jgi:DEAD/DEAH box helicase domain-containing protein
VPDILRTLESLRHASWYKGQVVHVAEVGSRTARYALPDPALPEPLTRYLSSAGIDNLYSHQVELLDAARKGRNPIITTATSSGKTLGFNLPVFEHMLRDRTSTALYLYPMKAVTRDQLRVLNDMEQATGLRLNSAVYDGDTPSNIRPRIRQTARIVLSNPYELHQVLPWHYKWARFFKGLRWVVVDEAHRYRGVFGSNVAQLFRRLNRLCKLYRARPNYVLSSASIANPQELAERLTGREFVHVKDDGSPSAQSFFLFWNPAQDFGTSVHIQTQRLVAHFAKSGFQTLCFVQSRRLAELVARWVREQLPELPVSSYRAGYLPKERRAIESALASGELRGVVSTDALELGIDIGGLDCIILSGYPGSLASLWQQAGRAGRKLQDSVIVFIGFNDALDQYLLRYPERVLARGFESAVVDLSNPHIVRGHMLCAASESPIKDEELKPEGTRLLEELEKELKVRKTQAGWIYTGKERPQETVQLERIAEQTVEVICEAKVLETMELGRAYREVHEGAVLMHRGETYVSKKLDLEAGRAEVEQNEVDYYTQVIRHEQLRLLETRKERELCEGCTLSLGRLQATETYTGYKTKRYDQVLSTNPLDLPEIEFPTVGLWLSFRDRFFHSLQLEEPAITGGMHGTEHAFIAIAPLVAMCDRMDIGGITYARFPGTGLPTLFLYDGYEDGIGISEKLFAEFDRLAKVTLELVSACGCDDGCPACVLSARCGDNNQPMDKPAAITILKALTSQAPPGHPG